MKIEHLAIWANDLEMLTRFYQKYFQAKASNAYHNREKNFTSRFLTFEEGARLEIMHRPDICSLTGNKKVIGLAHLAFSVGSQENVDKLTKCLEDDGYVVVGQPRTTGDGYYESVVLDLEGNHVEITI